MADVVDQPDAVLARRVAEPALEGLADAVRHQRAVDEREVRGGAHRGQVAPPLVRRDRGAAELPVGQIDAVAARGVEHDLDEVVADLVAEAARPRVDRERDAPLVEPEPRGRARVEDLVHDLDLDEVVARAHGAQLRPPPLLRPLRHRARVGEVEPAALLDARGLPLLGHPALHGPAGAVAQHLVEVARGQPEVPPLRADPRRDAAEQRVREVRHARREVAVREPRREQPHAAVDVVADAAGRHDPLDRVERGHAADREAVAPVDVGHGERVPDDARQVRHVGDLLGRLVGADLVDQRRVGVDQPGDPHPPGPRDAPAEVVQLFEDHAVELIAPAPPPRAPRRRCRPAAARRGPP